MPLDGVAAKRSTRTAVEQEIQTRSQRETETLRTRNAEINGLADQYVKDYGTRWNGKPGSVFVVGERIRALQMEAVSAPAMLTENGEAPNVAPPRYIPLESATNQLGEVPIVTEPVK